MEKEYIKKYLKTLLIVLAVILVFTFGDYLIHISEEEYAVPYYYYTNKIIFGTIIGFITYLFIQKKKPATRALIFSGVIAVLLQVRYFLEGYSRHFVFIFLLYHFLILLVVSWVFFKYVIEKDK